jgi:hypothetical protein
MRIHISESTRLLIEDQPYEIVERGKICVKGKGEMKTYFVLNRFNAKGQPVVCPFMEIFQEQKNKKSMSNNYKSTDVDIDDLEDTNDGTSGAIDPNQNLKSKPVLKSKDSVVLNLLKDSIKTNESVKNIQKLNDEKPTDVYQEPENVFLENKPEKVPNQTEIKMNKISEADSEFEARLSSTAKPNFDIKEVNAKLNMIKSVSMEVHSDSDDTIKSSLALRKTLSVKTFSGANTDLLTKSEIDLPKKNENSKPNNASDSIERRYSQNLEACITINQNDSLKANKSDSPSELTETITVTTTEKPRDVIKIEVKKPDDNVKLESQNIQNSVNQVTTKQVVDAEKPKPQAEPVEVQNVLKNEAETKTETKVENKQPNKKSSTCSLL